jgi:hypothetical protein
VTFWSEPIIIETGEFKGRRGSTIAISQPTNWDDGTPLTEPERSLVQERSRDALKFMGVPHVVT